jgi:hypothetical protein
MTSRILSPVLAVSAFLLPVHVSAGTSSPWWWEPIAVWWTLTEPRLAFDPEGDPWVVGLHRMTGEIVLYERAAGTWVLRPAPNGDFDDIRRRPALAFQPDGEPTVAWIDAQQDLMVATRSGSLWPEETAAAGNVVHPPSELDGLGVPASGDPRIIYFGVGLESACLNYVERVNAVWNELSLNCYQFGSSYMQHAITFREDGTPLAVTCQQSDEIGAPTHCWLRLYEGGTWRTRTMPVRHSPWTLDLDASGFAHAAGNLDEDWKDPEAPRTSS